MATRVIGVSPREIRWGASAARPPVRTRSARRLRGISPWIALATGALACFVLGSRAFDLPYQTLWQSLFVMKSSTAWFILLCSASLLLRWWGSIGADRMAVCLSVIVAVLTICLFADVVLGTRFAVDRWLLPMGRAPALPGPPAAVTSICFLAIATASLLSNVARIEYSQVLYFLSTSIPLVRLGGYLFLAPGVAPHEALTLTAIYTAVCELALCFAGLCLRPDQGLMRVVVSDSISGSTARRLLPLAFGVPVLIGYAVLIGERNGAIGIDLGLALVVAICALLFAAIVWAIMTLLWNGERVRDRFEAKLRASEVKSLTDKRRDEERMAYLSGLSDALRDLREPREIFSAAAASLGAYLGVGRCGFAHVSSTRDEVAVDAQWNSDLPRIHAVSATSLLGPVALGAVRASQVARIEERAVEHADAHAMQAETRGRDAGPLAMNAEPRMDDTQAQVIESESAGEPARAALWIPLLRDGDSTAVMFVQCAAAREWSDEEVNFAQTAARRTWSAIERARADTLLSESERRFRLLAANLEEADRRKDEFLATLAHELRNPLAPIRQAARVARAKGATTEQFEHGLEIIDRQVAHMGLLLDDLLDVSRITRGQLNLRKLRVPLRRVVDDAIEIAKPLIESKRHRLHVSILDEDVQIFVDPMRVSQMIGNLLINGAKYSDAYADISVRAEIGSDIVVSVRDSGIGIEPSMLPRVFSMFSQVKSALDRSDGGLGIGLSLVKGLVELHGGSVTAHSDGLGKGSEFTLRIPYSSAGGLMTLASPPDSQVEASGAQRQGERLRVPADSAAAPPTVAVRKRRVLVADDNRDAADTLNMLLELEGFEVKIAHDGREAVDAVDSFAPDVILLDVGMPKLNGYEAARELRARQAGQAVVLIAITGWGQPEDRQRAKEAGFDHHLTKPVDLDALLSALRG